MNIDRKIEGHGYELIQGDCISVLGEITDASIDLIVTDPPYRTFSGSNVSALGKRWLSSILKNADGRIFKHNDILAKDYMPELHRVLKPGRDAYVMSNAKNLVSTIVAAIDAGFFVHNILVWQKNNASANRWYMKNCEYVCYLYKKPARAINNKFSKTVHSFDIVRNRDHPTQKPVDLMRMYIENSSEPGWRVLDPFMGSGSTGLAAVLSGRNFVGIEIDHEYFAVAARRLSNGGTASERTLESLTAE